MVGSAVCFFFLKILKETFTAGIVKRKALFRKGLHNVQRIQKLPEGKGSILTSPVRMEHKPRRDISLLISLVECRNDQIYIRFCRNMPCDNFPGEQIHYNTKIIPFTVDLDVSNVTDPYEVGCFLPELLLQMIRAASVIRSRTANNRFIGRHFR